MNTAHQANAFYEYYVTSADDVLCDHISRFQQRIQKIVKDNTWRLSFIINENHPNEVLLSEILHFPF